MGKAYSPDLRDRIAHHIASGQSRRSASRHFGVSPSCAVKLAQRVVATGSTTPARQGRPPGDGKLDQMGRCRARHHHARAVGPAWVGDRRSGSSRLTVSGASQGRL